MSSTHTMEVAVERLAIEAVSKDAQVHHDDPGEPSRVYVVGPSTAAADLAQRSPEGLPDISQRTFEAVVRPVVNPSRRLAVTGLIIVCNLMQMICNAIGVGGGLAISDLFGVTGVQASWVGAAYPLTQGTFVLISGRFGAVYGHQNMLILGGLLLVVFTFACSFCNNFIAFNVMRAVSGIGGAFIMPNAVAMITVTNPPGFMRNVSLAFFGASAPIGGYLGTLIVGGFINISLLWMFVFVSLFGLVSFGTLWALLPREVPVDPHGKIDWLGSVLGLSGLIIFNAVWKYARVQPDTGVAPYLLTNALLHYSQAPSSGWSSPAIITMVLVAIGFFAAFGIWEHRFATEPIMPLRIFKAPSFTALIFVVLMNFMAIGTLLWYQVTWMMRIRNWTPLQFAVGWTPFGICGVAATFVAAWLIPRLSAQGILAIGTVAIMAANLLVATMPAQQTYWAQMFPATVLSAFSPDLIYTAAQIIASNSVRKKEQGIAGSLVGGLLLYGNSLGLGFSTTVDSEVTKRHPDDPIVGYRSALFFAVGICAIALVLDLAFVRMVKDEREGWNDPDDEDIVSAVAVTGIELQRIDVESRRQAA